ncbi:MAG TPA: PAS domain-containing protein [Myxococcaceae bacterium]|nr:PAS domain-containing protein [Myxococcaceae bacterium]
MSARDEGGGGAAPETGASRLATLLREQKGRILHEWERLAREQPLGRRLDHPQLVDHVPELLERIATAAERPAEAWVEGQPEDGAEEHAETRLKAGFNLGDALVEYRLLRRSILRVLTEGTEPLSAAEQLLLNDVLDQAVLGAVRHYTRGRERTLLELEGVSAAAEQGRVELDALLSRLLRVLPETVASVGLVVVFLREGNRLKEWASAGEDAQASRARSLEIGEGIAGRIAAERRPLTLRFATTDPVIDPGLMRGVRALYGVPLMQADELLGVAYMASRTAFDFSDYDKLYFRSVTGRVNALLVQSTLLRREREARAETSRTAAMLESLLAASPTAIAFLDRDLRYVRINDALAALNGRPAKEHLGRTAREIIPEVADFLEPPCRKVIDSGEPLTNLELSWALPSKPDDVRSWIANYHPVLGEGGEVLGVTVVMMEITARKRAEAALKENEERLRLFWENAGAHAFFTLDAQGRVHAWNAGAERVYGYAMAEIRGEPLARLYTPEEVSAGKPERLLAKVTQEGFAEVACARVRKGGDRFEANITVSAVRDQTGALRGFACVTCVTGCAPPSSE